jgi:hypothetical protein
MQTFFKYASLALVSFNRSKLLSVDVLTNVSQRVLATFNQSFIALDNKYDRSWAFQPVGNQKPFGLDFAPKQTVTATSTHTEVASYFCSTSYGIASFYRGGAPFKTTQTYYAPTATFFTTVTKTSTYWIYPLNGTSTKISSVTPFSQPESKEPFQIAGIMATLVGRTITTTSAAETTTPIMTTAVVSVQADILLISAFPVFFSIAILIYLIITIVVVGISSRALKKLPRDVACPASVFGFLYASDKFREWLRNGGLAASATDSHELLQLGEFTSLDGQRHWGIELVPDHPTTSND